MTMPGGCSPILPPPFSTQTRERFAALQLSAQTGVPRQFMPPHD